MIKKTDSDIEQVLTLIRHEEEVSIEKEAHEAIWYRMRSDFGLPFFISFGEKDSFQEIDTIGDHVFGSLLSFGRWTPPKHLSVWKTSSGMQCVLPAYDWKFHQQKRRETQETYLRESTFECTPTLICSESGYIECQQVFLRHNGGWLSLRLSRHNNDYRTLTVEEKMDGERVEHELQAEFLIGGITLSLADYLSLEPGDVVHIAESEEILRGVLCVGGVTIATGSLELSSDGMRLTLDEEKVGNDGNISDDSSIKEERELIQ